MTMNLLTTTAFVLRYYPPARGWGGRAVLPWLRWFADDRRAAHVTDSQGRLVAFGVARCLDNEADAADPYAHSEAGRIVFVDLAVARSRHALRALWSALRARFGPRARVAWQRVRLGEALRGYNFNQTERHIYGRR
jgi:hypothetical protein